MKLKYEVIAPIYVFGQTPGIQTAAYICMWVIAKSIQMTNIP